MEVETDDGAWAIPPYSGVWIPLANPTACGCRCEYAQPLHRAGCAAPGRPLRGAGYFPLLHQLLLASADMPALYDEDGRDGALAQLLLHEVRQAQTMPLFAPIPKTASLHGCARHS